MRHLILLRHAKAEEGAPAGAGDADRPLSRRGVRQLAVLPRMFVPCKHPPALVFASPAARTRATAEGLLAMFPEWNFELRLDAWLYLASADGILALLATVPDDVHSVCIVGHNPGLPELVERLTGVDVPMPTLGAAGLAVNVKRWRDVGPSSAVLAWTAVPGV